MAVSKIFNQYEDLYFGPNIYWNTEKNRPLFIIMEEDFCDIFNNTEIFAAYYDPKKDELDRITEPAEIKGIDWAVTDRFIYTSKYGTIRWEAINEIRIHENDIILLKDNEFFRLTGKGIQNIELLVKLIFRLGRYSRENTDWRYDAALIGLLKNIEVLGNEFIKSGCCCAGLVKLLKKRKREQIVKAYNDAFKERLKEELMIAYYDDTLMLTGEKGIVVTSEALYINKEGHMEKIPFLEMSDRPIYEGEETKDLIIASPRGRVSVHVSDNNAGKLIYGIIACLYDYYKCLV